MKKIILCISLLFIFPVSPAVAADWHTSTIKWVYPLGNGDFIITFSENDPLCSNASNYHHVKIGENGIDIEGSNKLYGAALAAGATRKTVTINYDETSSSCYINRLFINFQ